MNRFNIFGFSMSSPWHTTKHCVIHPGSRLILKRNDKGEYEPNILQCPECGTSYKEHENEAPSEDTLNIKHQKQQTKIISAKKKKKYYDKLGNEINDETLLKDIANGTRVIYYHEDKEEGDPNKPKPVVK